MATIDTDPTDGPTLSTNRPLKSLWNAGKFIVGAGLFFTFLGIAMNQVAPAIGNGVSALTGGKVDIGNAGIRVTRVA